MYDNYPPGAANDPNAPYNQPPSPEELFGDEADEVLNDEIDNLEEPFIEFLYEQGLAPDSDLVKVGSVTQETIDQIHTILSEDHKVREAYIEHNHDEKVDQLYNEACANQEPFEP